jgi:hypothetical protein
LGTGAADRIFSGILTLLHERGGRAYVYFPETISAPKE